MGNGLPTCVVMRMLRLVRYLLLFALAAGGAACSPKNEYTLYSTDSEQPRRHVATFDASADEAENRSNCHSVGEVLSDARDLRYWCEKGSYRP